MVAVNGDPKQTPVMRPTCCDSSHIGGADAGLRKHILFREPLVNHSYCCWLYDVIRCRLLLWLRTLKRLGFSLTENSPLDSSPPSSHQFCSGNNDEHACGRVGGGHKNRQRDWTWTESWTGDWPENNISTPTRTAWWSINMCFNNQQWEDNSKTGTA